MRYAIALDTDNETVKGFIKTDEGITETLQAMTALARESDMVIVIELESVQDAEIVGFAARSGFGNEWGYTTAIESEDDEYCELLGVSFSLPHLTGYVAGLVWEFVS